MALNVNLLGQFEVSFRNKRLSPFESRKVEELFAYLVLHPERPHPRLQLASTLWPEKGEAKGRTSLRHGLYVLKRSLRRWEDYLHVDRHEVMFKAKGHYGLDVERFQNALAQRQESDPQTRVRHLREAIALYRGPLLDGCYEEWVITLRERFLADYLQAVTELIEHHERRGRWQRIVDRAQQLLQAAPHREMAYAQLMRAHANLGDLDAVHEVYRRCQKALNRIDAEPSDSTLTLYDQLTEGADSFVPAKQPACNFTLPLTPLIGRQRELEALKTFIGSPQRRLVSVIGLGGIGKTHLTLQAAHELCGCFSDGVRLVSFEGVETELEFLGVVAKALDVTFAGSANPKTQLGNVLQKKHLLLVLDSFERVLPHAAVVLEWLQSAPKLHVLATSRERLQLAQEQTFFLEGLSVLTGDDARRPQGAVALFLHHALRLRPNFPTVEETPHIVTICRWIHGIPLAIELAASWTDSVACQTIARRLETNLGFEGNPKTLKALRPQRSLKAVLEHSWQGLSPEAQRVFARLSVFRGGFSTQAAQEVANASLSHLSLFTGKALLNHATDGALTLHDRIQDFAEAKLNQQARARSKAADQHGRFYLNMLREKAPCLGTRRENEALAALKKSFANVAAAWRWAAAHGQFELLDGAVPLLYEYCFRFGLFHEGIRFFSLGRNIALDKSSPAETCYHYARLSAREAVMWERLSRYAEAASKFQRALALLDGLDFDPTRLAQETAFVTARFAIVKHMSDQQAEAKAMLNESLLLSKKVGPPHRFVQICSWTTVAALARGDYDLAQNVLQKGTATSKKIDYPLGEAFCDHQWAGIEKAKGKFKAAQKSMLRAYPVLKAANVQWSMASWRMGYAELLLVLGKAHQAKTLFARMSAFFEQVGSNWGVTAALMGFGLTALEEGSYGDAQKHFEKAIAIARERGSGGELALPLSYLSLAHCLGGQLEQAIEPLSQALNWALQNDDKRVLQDALIVAGLLQLKQHSVPQGATLLSHVLGQPTINYLLTLRRTGLQGAQTVHFLKRGLQGFEINF